MPSPDGMFGALVARLGPPAIRAWPDFATVPPCRFDSETVP